jgi:rSAM-associated Gly-rich repeat protein
MTFLPRSGLFGFLLILSAVAPAATLAAPAGEGDPASAPQALASSQAPLADDSVDARLRRISAALRERDAAAIGDPEAASGRQAVDGKLAWVFANGGGVGFRNGGFRNGGFLNGGGFRNGGFYNGGFRNGGFLNGGGFRNGGWGNYW